MEKYLKNINAVVGVTGSFVCNEDGEVLASALPGIFDDAILSAVGRTAAQTIAGLQIVRKRKAGDIDLVYREGRFVIKNLRGACLCILCGPRMNVPLLNLTANVAARRLSEKLKAREKAVSRQAPSGPLVDTAFFSRMKHELTKEMGPIAAFIINEEVAALGEDKDSFRLHKATELVARVGAKIGNEENRLRFQRIMRETFEGL